MEDVSIRLQPTMIGEKDASWCGLHRGVACIVVWLASWCGLHRGVACIVVWLSGLPSGRGY
jgi:hypothetical protein